MIVKCIANDGQGFSEKTIVNLKNTKDATTPLKVGENYVVYGQMIYKEVLNYLIIGTYENLPTWYPAELFEVISPLMYYESYYMYVKIHLLMLFGGLKN